MYLPVSFPQRIRPAPARPRPGRPLARGLAVAAIAVCAAALVAGCSAAAPLPRVPASGPQPHGGVAATTGARAPTPAEAAATAPNDGASSTDQSAVTPANASSASGAAAQAQQRQLAVTTLGGFQVVLTATRSPGNGPGPMATVTAAAYQQTPSGWTLIASKQIGDASQWSWYATGVCSFTVTALAPAANPIVTAAESITVSLLATPAIRCMGPYTYDW
jgi:hypothetical protein